jgi:hypothetical protein
MAAYGENPMATVKHPQPIRDRAPNPNNNKRFPMTTHPATHPHVKNGQSALDIPSPFMDDKRPSMWATKGWLGLSTA